MYKGVTQQKLHSTTTFKFIIFLYLRFCFLAVIKKGTSRYTDLCRGGFLIRNDDAFVQRINVSFTAETETFQKQETC